MSKYNDNMFRLLQQFIDKYGDDFESIDEAIQTFMESYHEDNHHEELSKSPEMISMDLLYEAMETKGRKKQEDLIHQALELWPENWDAHSFLIQGDIIDQINEFTYLESRARDHWSARNMGGWGDIDARPYFRVKYHLIVLLAKQGLLNRARQHMEEYLEQDEFDALGVRYQLMAVLCQLYDWEGAMHLFEALPYEGREDDRMVLMMLVLAILTDRETYALDFLADLKSLNDDIRYLIKFKSWPIEKILAYNNADQIQPNSFDSIAITLLDLMPMVISSDYSFQWIKRNYKKADSLNRINLNNKVISFAGVIQQRDLKLMEEPLFKNITQNAFFALVENGFKELADFAQATEQEILTIKYVGPKTVEHLKENGVKFKEEA